MGVRQRKSTSIRYAGKFKVKVIRTALEKHLTVAEVQRLYHISDTCYYNWKRRYLKDGESALLAMEEGNGHRKPGSHRSPVDRNIREQILQAKQKYPFFGVARLWHWMRRTLVLPISRRQIHRTLEESGMIASAPGKKKAVKRKIRFFERSRPNQMWQSDITTFTLSKGLQVWLIGFLDDHSRYMVGWGLYAGQSGALVLEVFRRAVATYGRPEEMLTDQGRQYKSWRGVTDFERELKQEGIKHIVSRPHHPQTLGKIESFWGHLKKEFVSRVVMGDLEDMRERLKHWIAYYNFQRPHEGIGNIAPAERYFRYSALVKEEIAKQIGAQEKVLALRDPVRQEVLGEVSIGGKTIQVRKEDRGICISMNAKEVGHDEAEEKSSGNDIGGGSAREGEGCPGTGGALGGENGGGSVPGDGIKTLAVLQDGREDGRGDGGCGQTAGGTPASPEPAGSDERTGGGDGASQAGTSADEKSDADLAQVAQGPEPTAKNGDPSRETADGTVADGGTGQR